MIRPALVERDDLRLELGLVLRFLLDRGDDGPTLERGLLGPASSAGTASLTRSVTSRISIEDVQLDRLALRLVLAAIWRGSRRGSSSSSLVPSFCRASAPTWWLVRTRPSAETNEPDPPLLKRTEAFCRWSSHSCSTLKSYFFLSSFGRQVVEQPHTLVGAERRHRQQARHQERGQREPPSGSVAYGRISYSLGQSLLVERSGRVRAAECGVGSGASSLPMPTKTRKRASKPKTNSAR